jgi:hypothetical protein
VAGRRYIYKVFESAYKTYLLDPETLVEAAPVES